MNLDLEKASKPLQKLRKALKKLDDDPGEVHKLRTNARKVEALLRILPGQRGKAHRNLLEEIKPVRKAAGQVRDMDVLIAKANLLDAGSAREGLVRLVEHLANTRHKGARRLQRQLEKHGPELRNLLKRTEKSLGNGVSSEAGAVFEPPAGPQILAAELEHWPKLHRDNLHEFRIHLKELRYMLQFFKEKDDDRLDAYAQVNDTAGEWHDWLELQNIAAQLLTKKQDAALMRSIRETTREKLRTALTTANAVRKQSFAF